MIVDQRQARFEEGFTGNDAAGGRRNIAARAGQIARLEFLIGVGFFRDITPLAAEVHLQA